MWSCRRRWGPRGAAAAGTCLVAVPYTSAWCGTLQYADGNDLLGTMADCYTRIYLNVGVDEMAWQASSGKGTATAG